MTSPNQTLARPPAAPEAERETDRTPRTWALLAHRAGDNEQVVALADALGWPYEIKRFTYNRYEVLVSWPFATTLAGVQRSHSSELAPPWPDLVLTSGRRNEPIARWIQARPRHRVRRVHVGRPWERIQNWDLVVTTPQYRLPHLPNVVHNEMPLHRISPARLREATRTWTWRLAHLPRPRIAVLVGGSSGPYVFDRQAARELARRADALASEAGGSLLITTSARTSNEATEALFGSIQSPAFRHQWSPGDTENPYLAFLGMADRVIATGDSVSMMAEACATGCPVYLFDFGRGRYAMRDETADAAPVEPLRQRLQRRWLKAWIYRATMRCGPNRLTRDIRVIHRALIESGRVAWLGDGTARRAATPLVDVERAVSHVRTLFGTQPSGVRTPLLTDGRREGALRPAPRPAQRWSRLPQS
jgi:mitochondrial fission protein ELM1